jgi:hypothetical protein
LVGVNLHATESDSGGGSPALSIVHRLSGPSFQDRLDAEEEALRSGDSVLPALQQAQSSQDPELRLRARYLIQRIEQDGLQLSIRAFLAPNSTTDLPGWSMVEEIVEDNPGNRQFYADLLRAEPLLTQALRRPDRLAAELTRRQQEYGHAILSNGLNNQSPMRVAALMILLLHPGLDVPDLVRNDASQIVMYGINGGGDSPADRFIQALATRWVITPNPVTAQRRFDLARRMNIREVVAPALEMLRQRPVPPQAAAYFTLVARHGGPEEMAELETLLDDTSEQSSHEQSDKSRVQTQVRDLALAALIEMTKQKPEEAGLKLRDRSGNPAFESNEAREIALEKWKVWKAQHLKKYWEFPQIAIEGITL